MNQAKFSLSVLPDQAENYRGFIQIYEQKLSQAPNQQVSSLFLRVSVLKEILLNGVVLSLSLLPSL